MRDFIEEAFVLTQIELLRDIVENENSYNSWRRYLPTRWGWEYKMVYSALDNLVKLGLVHKYGLAGYYVASFKGQHVYNRLLTMGFSTNNFKFIYNN